MARVDVFFLNGHAVTFDRDKVAFKAQDGSFFTVSDNYLDEDSYCNLAKDGKSLINWENVCYIREHTERDELDDD